MKIYNDLGYLDVPKIRSRGLPFIFITGGRGTGKTYGTLDDVLEHDERFIFMRRTQSELDSLASNDELNPFQEHNEKRGRRIGFVRSSKYTYNVVDRDQADDGTLLRTGKVIGLAVALSTIANIRGFNALGYTVIIYDEFIPELHARPIREEAMAFLNAYETINRNRELQGREPVQCICLSNSNRLDNQMYVGLGLVSKVDRMKARGQSVSRLDQRGILLINMEDSPISQKKRDTALYRMAAGTAFESMALDNKYVGEDERGRISSRPLIEYSPVVAVGELCIYRHKDQRDLYVCTHVSGNPPVYGSGDTELTRFRRLYAWVWLRYLDNGVIFESRICEILLTRYFE